MLILLNLLSAVALLVWGSHIVRTGILRVFGSDLRTMISRSTDGKLRAFAAGIGVTSLVQSSNATAVIVASFAAQNLLPLTSGLAILLGADVGTALMARVLTLDLSWLSPLFILVGVFLFLSRKQHRVGQIGRTGIGLGMILLALHLIVEAAQPMMEGNGIRVMFGALTGDTMLDALVGAAFAIVSYSSLAAVLLTATLAASHVISLKVALCLVVGANLGSGLLAMFGTLAQNAAARRLSAGSLLFKFAGAVLILPFAAMLADGLPLLIADARETVVTFHLVYNVARCVVCLLFIGPVATLCTRFLPDKPMPTDGIRPLHLDETALTTPTLALANAAREVLRVGDIIRSMLGNVGELIRSNDATKATETVLLDNDVDELYRATKQYLSRISREDLDDADNQRWTDIFALTINLEHAGDIIERIANDVKERKIAQRLAFSEEGAAELNDLYTRLQSNLQLGLSVFFNNDLRCAEQLLMEKECFRDLERKYANAHVDRLVNQTLRSIETSALHLDMLSDMRRLNSLFCSTSYSVLEAASKLHRSRLRGRTNG
ncbi:membrane protein [Burkholderia cepacia]|uniref:Membrane protein n=1 Tax=Burkholderia cepacia TaxID=292 RepID=A0A0J5WQM3_BURCE|nr:Na/Pi cotransporter family protein [Burkholderia cepacia]KML54771.1 membrane protein [Burkholderia cepacia]